MLIVMRAGPRPGVSSLARARAIPRVARWLAALLVVGGGLATAATPAAAQPTSVTFAAGGDHGPTAESVASLVALAGSGASFYLALGDLSYGTVGTEPAWCDLVKSHVGSTFPFQLVSGNHEDDIGGNGFIDGFTACLPDRLGSTGRYGVEYHFDYGGLLRVILVAPGLTIGGETYRYASGDPHYQWLAQRIDEARAAGIPWVVVGMHKACITIGAKACEIGSDLMDLLIAKRVDLVLQGHDHNYQRSKQLACARANAFVSSCVASDGATGRYAKGAGTVFVIAGAFGRGLYAVDPGDPEAGYFARWMGLNAGPTNGFLRVTVSASELSADFVATSGSGSPTTSRSGCRRTSSCSASIRGRRPSRAHAGASSAGSLAGRASSTRATATSTPTRGRSR